METSPTPPKTLDLAHFLPIFSRFQQSTPKYLFKSQTLTSDTYLDIAESNADIFRALSNEFEFLEGRKIKFSLKKSQIFLRPGSSNSF